MASDTQSSDPVSPEPPSADPLARAAAWLDDGLDVAVAVVVATWGSSPRRPGSVMCMNERGDFLGSVSGGCVETAVVEEAGEVLRTGRPKLLEYGVTNDRAWEVGLACGGTVEVWVERVSDHAELEHAVPPVARGGTRVVGTDLTSGSKIEFSVTSQPRNEDEVANGNGTDTPEDPHPDSRSDPHARARTTARATSRDPAGPDLRSALLADVHDTVATGRSRVVEVEGRRVFLHLLAPPVRVVVVGAVHIAQSLVEMAKAAGFDAVVVDPRTAFATPDRFPGVELVHRWPAEAFERIGLDDRTAVVALSHDPKLDDPALETALASDAFYVGALGSRRTHARRMERLRAAGVTDEALGRIRAPIGLDLGGRTPGEIAVAVLAEVVRDLRGTPE